MARPFPDLPFFRGNFAPLTMECDAPDLPVLGEIPRDLHGTLFRNGPNPQYAPRDSRTHWFLGDGMVHAFHIEEGRVAYRNRWVRTPRWQAEHAARRPLFGPWGSPMGADPSVAGIDGGVANTHVLSHAGRLLALEEAHRPFALDPATLDPLGYCDLGDGMPPRFTAHPKTDPETGEMIFFAYSVDRPLGAGMAWGVLDAAGRLARVESFEAPFASMVHDFLVTRRHVIFPVLPLTGSLARAMRGGPPFAWEPDLGARLGVMRRDQGVASLRWFDAEACHVFHALNAWEDAAGRLHADVMESAAPPLFPRADGSPVDPALGTARLTRWSLDPGAATDTFRRAALDDLPAEFPRLDERFAGLPNRYGFYACRAGTAVPDGGFDSLAAIDLASGTRRLFILPPGDQVSEPVFVPRSPNAAEGEGWLLAVAWRAAERRSDLILLPALEPDAGPVATVPLAHRVPHGFHGSWRPAG